MRRVRPIHLSSNPRIGCDCRSPVTLISRRGNPSSMKSSLTRRPTGSERRTISGARSKSPVSTSRVGLTFSKPACWRRSAISSRARVIQKLWIGPNEHYFVYHRNFWPRDPYFAWFDYWLKGEPTGIMDEPAVYYSPRAWVDDREAYTPAEWRYAELWPPPEARLQRLYLRGDSTLSA